ncbi:4-hydroxybenzoate 3-monooxygenase [Ruicaihuangia caeni]|uniref:4-hydroxybenzoate 3-monooxygenase n=1 Tax=Ruicaihuangia caeni TaxID=3042517 RepID=A0AAW6T3U4_9MICO|nr:4-hydroxybenzoate 3-monooxygenase [Klugiella sp. YN-L-19]MDI2098480.1 4-hydroxybenzoate 3-monooxygenase [Klugiella sp. YN-L-19]
MASTARTQVAIIGAGPAGLMLSHLLHRAGIHSIVIDGRSRDAIEQTIRAGILENGTVDLLTSADVSQRVLAEGHRHDGIELRFEGTGHRIDFADLVGRAVWLYPQHEVLKDLIAARLRDGGEVRFESTATEIMDADSDAPRVIGTGADGHLLKITADFVIGADGSQSIARETVTGSRTGGHFREYPFAWFGILTEAPPSAPELIYSASPHGFALISQRSDTVQRMYLQCDPELDPASMSDPEIWDALQTRVGGGLIEGPIFQRDVLRFRSFVAHRLRRGRAFLVGDAAHTVPPTGAKGLNLAVADVLLLSGALQSFYETGSEAHLDAYPERALDRIWRAQHFSWWMTSMLHAAPDATEFDLQRRFGELHSVTSSRAGRTYLAEAYTGWPLATF